MYSANRERAERKAKQSRGARTDRKLKGLKSDGHGKTSVLQKIWHMNHLLCRPNVPNYTSTRVLPTLFPSLTQPHYTQLFTFSVFTQAAGCISTTSQWVLLEAQMLSLHACVCVFTLRCHVNMMISSWVPPHTYSMELSQKVVIWLSPYRTVIPIMQTEGEIHPFILYGLIPFKVAGLVGAN